MQILKSIHGPEVGLGADSRLMVPAGVILGSDGSQVALPAPDRVAIFDDFLGPTLRTEWAVTKGSDGGAANFAPSAALCGMARAVTGAGAGASMAVNGVQLNGALNWQANQGDLVVQARVKIQTIANIAFYFGLTDQTAALEDPITGAGGGDGITTNATDAVGFLYDTTMTTKHWWLVGVANDVDAAPQDSGGAPVANTYDVLRIEVRIDGSAYFYRNGLLVGNVMAGACRPTIPLTPVIAAFSRSAASQNIDAELLHVSAKRV